MLAHYLFCTAASRSRRRPDHASRRPPVRASSEFPDDPALPALGAIRAMGLARAIPSLGLPDDPVELILRAYKPGARATFEARVGSRRFAVKAYASGASSEAALYDALRAAGIGGQSGARVPPLLAFERNLEVVVIGWLEGPTASDLVKRGEGRGGGGAGVGGAAGAGRLAAGAPPRARAGPRAKEPPPCLVPGTLYARHIIDAGAGPGVIDWQRLGRGPAEFDAGTFLATIW